jgi:hypothetical protein
MKASRFSDAKKAFILKQGADGMPVADICRTDGISEATYFNWKKKYDGLLPSDALRLVLAEIPAFTTQQHMNAPIAVANSRLAVRTYRRSSATQLAARSKLIMHKVHSPGLVRSCRALRRSSRSFALTRRFGVLFRNCRPNSR